MVPERSLAAMKELQLSDELGGEMLFILRDADERPLACVMVTAQRERAEVLVDANDAYDHRMEPDYVPPVGVPREKSLDSEAAIKRLPSGPLVEVLHVATGRFSREDLEWNRVADLLAAAPVIRDTGHWVTRVGYGMVINEEGGALFIQTREERP